jgi:hypothetical protein
MSGLNRHTGHWESPSWGGGLPSYDIITRICYSANWFGLSIALSWPMQRARADKLSKFYWNLFSKRAVSTQPATLH